MFNPYSPYYHIMNTTINIGPGIHLTMPKIYK